MTLKSFVRTLLLLYVAASIAVLVVKVARGGPSVPLDPESRPTTMTETPDSAGSPYSETDPSEGSVPETLVAQDPSPNRIIVYYFHRSIRCVGCVNVEEAAFEAVSNDFERGVGKGVLEWRSVNIDEPENEHFIDAYNLYYQELVFVELRDGVEVRWDDIAEVWRHWNSKMRARTVVRDELNRWLKGVVRDAD